MINLGLSVLAVGLLGIGQYQYFIKHHPNLGGLLSMLALGCFGLWLTRRRTATEPGSMALALPMQTGSAPVSARLKPWEIGVMAAALLLGQAFILGFNRPVWGMAISGLGVVVGLARIGFNLLKTLSVLMAWLAVVLGLFAQFVVKQQPVLGLWLFFSAGVCLFISRSEDRRFFDGSGVREKSAAFEKWEIWFLLALLGYALVTRFAHINNFPYSAIREEGELLPVIGDAVANHLYMPHFLHGNMGIPTLIGYIGYYWGSWFGFTIDNLRVGTELFSVFGILIFYFTARRLTSPATAAVSTLLFASCTILLVLARRFYPYAVLQFTPLAAVGLLVAAMSRKRMLLYILAGLALGLSLHGHEPGRGAFLIFLLWMVWMFIFHRKKSPSLGEWGVFWVGFLVTASPIIYHAYVYWDNYWNYVNHHVNPNWGKSYWTVFQFVWSKIPTYAAMFHVKGESVPVVHFQFEEALNPVAGLFFGMGFFYCTARFWQPVPALLMMYFFAGMMPAMIAGGYAEPTTRRMSMAFPAVFLMAAMALEKIRLSVTSGDFTWPRRAVMAIALAAGIWSGYHAIRYFFYEWADYPGSRHEYCYRAYLKCEAERAYPQARIMVQEYVQFPQECVIYPEGEKRPKGGYRTNEEYLIMDAKQDYLFCFEGYMEAMQPFFQRIFPHAEIAVHREKKIGDPICQQWEFLKNSTDPHNPAVYLFQMYVPKEDIQDFQSLLLLQPSTEPKRLAVFAPAFAQTQQGKYLRLAGALLTRDGGEFSFSLPWGGWSLSVDRRPAAWNQTIKLNGSIHYFEIQGPVPNSAQGPMPLRILQGGGQDCVAQGQVVALRQEMGLADQYMPGDNNWTGAPVYSRQELFAAKRFYDVTEIPVPYSTRFSGRLTVPTTGIYHFSAKPFAGYRILVDNKEVFNNFKDLSVGQREPIELTAGKPVKFEAFFRVGGEVANRTFMVFYTGPGQSVPTWVPLEWFSLE